MTDIFHMEHQVFSDPFFYSMYNHTIMHLFGKHKLPMLNPLKKTIWEVVSHPTPIFTSFQASEAEILQALIRWGECQLNNRAANTKGDYWIKASSYGLKW